MKKLFIQSVKSRTIDDPYPFVRFYEREPIPDLSVHNGPPEKDYIEYEMLHAQAYISINGEVNICMSEQVRDILGIPLDYVEGIRRQWQEQQDRNFDLNKENMAIGLINNKLERELKRLNDLRWYQRLWAVFFGLETGI